MGLKVIAIDGGDEKGDAVMKLGAQHYVDFQKSKDLVEDVKAASRDGLGPDAVLLVAVNEKPFQQAADVSTKSPGPLLRVSCKSNGLPRLTFSTFAPAALSSPSACQATPT